MNSVESKKSQRIEDTYERMRDLEAVFKDSRYRKEPEYVHKSLGNQKRINFDYGRL